MSEVADQEVNEVPVKLPTTPPADPPVAPVVAPPTEPAVIPQIGPAQAPAPTQWVATGNEQVDTLGSYLASAGAPTEKFREEFGKTGTVSAETFNEIESAIDVSAAKLVKQQILAAAASVQSNAQKAANAIYESVGGEAEWQKVATFAKTLPEADRAEYNVLLKAGGKSATLAAKELKGKMMADPEFAPRAELLGTDVPVTNGQAPAVKRLDRATYQSQIQVAERRGDKLAIANLRKRASVDMKANPYWRMGNPA